MDVTPSGIFMLVKLVQPSNALFSIDVKPVGKTTPCTCDAPLKELAAIVLQLDSTVYGLLAFPAGY
jgi:hypothetical protein